MGISSCYRLAGGSPSRARKVTCACVRGSADFNRKKWRKWWSLGPLSFDIETRELVPAIDWVGVSCSKRLNPSATRPQGPEKLHVRVCWAVPIMTEKMTKMVEFGSVELWHFKKDIRSCYRLREDSPVQKVENREQPDLHGPKSYMCVRVGQCLWPPGPIKVTVGAVLIIFENMTKMVKFGSDGFFLILQLEKGKSSCYRFCGGSPVQND